MRIGNLHKPEDPASGWLPVRHLSAALLTALLIAAPLTGQAESPDRTSFRFEAPEAHSGPIALRMTFDFGADNPCVFRTVTSGVTRAPPILFYEERTFAGAAYSRYTAQTHGHVAGRQVDTRELLSPGGAWSITTTISGPFSGVEPYTLVVFDAAAWSRPATGAHEAVLIEVECGKPFTVGDFARGDEAIGFTADSMRGGTGASVNQVAGSATYADGDNLTATFTHSETLLRASTSSGNAEVRGDLYLRAGGTELAWRLEGTDAIAWSGGPASYTATLDYVGVGLSERFLGVMYGLDPVAAL